MTTCFAWQILEPCLEASTNAIVAGVATCQTSTMSISSDAFFVEVAPAKGGTVGKALSMSTRKSHVCQGSRLSNFFMCFGLRQTGHWREACLSMSITVDHICGWCLEVLAYLSIQMLVFGCLRLQSLDKPIKESRVRFPEQAIHCFLKSSSEVCLQHATTVR